MELDFVFEGIELSGGQYPRARVRVQQVDPQQDEGLALVRIDITLPIRHLDASTAACRDAALRCAQQLVNQQVLQDWLDALPATGQDGGAQGG